ncbi:MAG: hypothetical protein IJR26_05655 [Bacteroidales bacterium]|nr:hypothetical protein [Bacteroidales bacterium]
MSGKITGIGERTVNVPAELLNNKLTSKALGIIEKSAMSDDQLMAYEHFWLADHDNEALRSQKVKPSLWKGWDRWGFKS